MKNELLPDIEIIIGVLIKIKANLQVQKKMKM